MIKLNSKEAIDKLLGTGDHFKKVLCTARVDEVFAGGKKLDDWLDKKTLNKLLITEPKEMRPTFEAWY